MVKYIKNMIPYVLIGAIIYIIIRGIIFLIQRKSFCFKKELASLFFVLYCVGLASQTIIPKFEFGNVGFGIIGAFEHRINLIPFKVIQETYIAVNKDHYYDYFIINFLGNILIFVPFGFFLPIIFRKMDSLKRVLFTGFAISLFIEIIQFPLYRGTDIDDLWLNTSGVLVGYLTYKTIKNILDLRSSEKSN